MAFENLFIRTQKSIGGIQLDAIITEDHESTITPTKNPIELGADITDHAIINPKKLTVFAEVSDTPLSVGAAIGEIIDTVTGLFGSSTEENETRSNAAFNSIIALQEAREPIEVQTKFKLYENMLITSVRDTVDVDSSRIASMSISLEEIIISETEIVAMSESTLAEGTTSDQASSAANKGNVEPITEPEESSANKSVLKAGLDFFQ